jgi:eukaryotic-like serine/threonine-protein kinase
VSAIDPQRWLRASRHLDRALDLPPHERAACLAALRAEDPESAADVEAMLAEHHVLSAEGFLDTAAPLHLPDVPRPLTGVTIGPYTLQAQIGHGGMGTVWSAVRSDGRFEGRAAVKLLNAALVGRAGEERFKREGTILARLTHPHIARLTDAGVTATGQPYLVLEHIDGQHIDRYCDDRKLGIDDRIRLFLDVQSAVAHAHANLIVHRDLKPSNVLVTGDGQVKLLDFGIAKLLGQDDPNISSSTMLTVEGAHVLTPKYAAPEQVTGGRITTATDVYSLGVLLFELLSGVHPTGLDTATPAEFVKAVADTEPLRLSTAATQAVNAGRAADLATRRATTPERLRKELGGDLETVLAKALKSNPAERYASLVEFSDDLRRVLNNQPIGARPDSLKYRAVKFASRHRPMIAAATVALVILVGLVAYYTVQLKAERDRARLQAAKASQVSELLTRLLTGADPYRTPDAKEPTVQNLLDIGAEQVSRDLNDQPELQAEMFTVIGRTYERMGATPKALPLLERALAIGRQTLGPDHARIAQSLNDLGVLYREQGRFDEAEKLLTESLAMRRRVLGSQNNYVAITLVELGRSLNERGRSNQAEPLFREALAIRRAVYGDEHRETATSKSDLGMLLLRRGDLAGAEPLLRENVATTVRTLGADHPNAAWAKSMLASLLIAKGEAQPAETLLREAMDLNRRVFADKKIEYVGPLSTLSYALEVQGRLEEAQAVIEECLTVAQSALAADNPRVLTYMTSLARIRIARGDAAATEPALRFALEARQRFYPPDDWRIAQTQSLLGAALLAQQRYAEAEPLLIAADKGLEPIPGMPARARDANRAWLVSLYTASGRPQQAAAYRFP